MSANPLEQYIPRPAFCEQLGITTRTAELWAHARKGPRVTIIAKRAYYHVDDVQQYLDECRNTAPRAPRARAAA